MSGSATLRQLTVERDAANHEKARLRSQVYELEQQVAVLEARVAGLRGLGTPGLVIEALDQITQAAADGLAVANNQVIFWTTVGQWAGKLATAEREDWGDLVP